MKNLFVTIIVFTVLMLSAFACSNSTEPESSGTINLSAKYSESLQKTAGVSATGVIINKVTYLLREIKFKTQKDSTDGMFKLTPLVLELNTAGNVQEIGGLVTPFGTYNRLEFDIHRAESKDTSEMSLEQRIRIRPFLSGDKYSVIIEGIVIDGATQANFVYKSRMNAKQKIDLIQDCVVSESDNTINVTMFISSNGWFMDNGNILDPNDPKNESKIDDNIRKSIKSFKDKNRDGMMD